MYFCTPSGTRPLKLPLTAIAMAALSLPMSAQKAPTSSNTTQAELHLQVNVVPVVAPHREHKDRDRDEGPVAYNLGSREEDLSVSQDVRTVLTGTGESPVRQEQVRIITVVLK